MGNKLKEVVSDQMRDTSKNRSWVLWPIIGGIIIILVLFTAVQLTFALQVSFEYTNPATGNPGLKDVQTDISGYRAIPGTNVWDIYLRGIVDGTTYRYININDAFYRLLDGMPSNPPQNIVEGYLTDAVGAGTTTFYIDRTGFAAGDAISIMSTQNGTGALYTVIDSISNNTELSVSRGVGNDYAAGAVVQKCVYPGQSVGSGNSIGLKAWLEKPIAVSYANASTSSTAGGKIQVGWIRSTSAVVGYYDIYASATALSVIPANLIPTYSDATWSTNTASMSTGTQVTCAATSTPYYVYIVAKSGQGQHGIAESDMRGIASVTVTSSASE